MSGIVGFSEDSLMCSIPWDEIEEGFNRRAEAAGFTGWRKYQYHESYSVPVLDPEIEKAAREMSFSLARGIAELFTEGNLEKR